jgi:acetylornithine/N-succinyldiaminopimelate aminotransferase
MGLKCRVAPADLVHAAREAGVLLVGAADNVARVIPPLIVSDAEIDEGVRRIGAACAAVAKARAA